MKDKQTQKTLEEEIFQMADEALKNNVPLQKGMETLKRYPVTGGDVRPDRLVRMVIHGKELKYCAEIKANITKAQRLLLLMNQQKFEHPVLVITRHVNTETAEELRKNKIEFIDTAGNAFLDNPPVYVFIKGNRPPEATTRGPVKRAFKPGGLRMIFGFLCNPGLENKTFREIAAATGVALGTVDWIMKELKELEFLVDMGKRGIKLMRKEALLQRWVAAYPEQLRPKQILGRYKGPTNWWEQKELNPLEAEWGGEIAAERMTHYLKPEMITIYVGAQYLNQLLLENRLRTDIAGDVEILARFWKTVPEHQPQELVPPILVYADLLATGNQRNLETAKMIYEQNVIRFIGED